MSLQYIDGFKSDESQLGLFTNIYFALEVLRGAEGSFKARHAFSLQDEPFIKTYRKRKATGGLDIVDINIANNSLTAGTDKITLNGVDYTFVASGATTFQINIGTDAAETETNIATKLDALTGIDASVVSNKVRVTSTTKKVTITTNAPSKVTITNTPTAAQLKLILSGSNIIFKTQQSFRFHIPVNGKKDIVTVMAITPDLESSSTPKADLTTRVKAVLALALAGTKPTGTGVVYSKNLASKTQISAGLQAVFGSDPDAAFLIGGDDLNELTLKAAGTTGSFVGFAGNELQVEFFLGASEPDLVFTFGKRNNPEHALYGALEHAGSTLNYKRASKPSTGSQDQDNTRQKFLTKITGLEDEISFVLNQLHNPRLQQLVSGLATISIGDQNIYVLPNGDEVKLTVIAVTELPDGNNSIDICPEVLVTGGLNKELGKGSTGGLQFTGLAIPIDTADSPGYSYIKYREDAQ